jgi:protein disulfide-isomerase A1
VKIQQARFSDELRFRGSPPKSTLKLILKHFQNVKCGHKLTIATVFAPWCGHCKALAPEYETAATQLTEKNIPLAKVDCTEQADLCQEYGVEGYPTLKVFRGPDNVAAYSGARKADA